MARIADRIRSARFYVLGIYSLVVTVSATLGYLVLKTRPYLCLAYYIGGFLLGFFVRFLVAVLLSRLAADPRATVYISPIGRVPGSDIIVMISRALPLFQVFAFLLAVVAFAISVYYLLFLGKLSGPINLMPGIYFGLCFGLENIEEKLKSMSDNSSFSE